MKFPFTYTFDLTPATVLAAAGIFPGQPQYLYLETFAMVAIQQNVELVAVSLNRIVRDRFRRAMMGIWEYQNYPAYMDRLDTALSDPRHTRAEYLGGRIQAVFIDTDILGDLQDVLAAQAYAYPKRGTLQAWTGFYMAFVEGKKGNPRYQTQRRQYENTIDKRLSYMASHGNSAPFWMFIDEGNYVFRGFPRNNAMNVIDGMKLTYKRMMREAFMKAAATMRVYAAATPRYIFGAYPALEVNFEGKIYKGYSWTAKSGARFFVIEGTQKVVAGQPWGRGFILNNAGKILRKWGGWLPK